jgi:glycosyltransferase involved in cell wall biosynthesis
MHDGNVKIDDGASRPVAEPRGERPGEIPPKVAYVMSRFPKLTETFVLYEMLAVERSGVPVEIFPLLRERAPVMHSEARALVDRAHFQPFLSWAILRAHGHFLLHKPRAYFSAFWSLLRGTWGSFNFFTGAIGIFPKTVYFARRMAAEGVTHVHAHFASHPAAAAFVVHRLVGIPYSFTAHGSDLHIERRMLREKVAEAAFVVAISEYNRELILTECGPEHGNKTIVIHCGVDTDVFRHRTANDQRMRADEPFHIVCVGTLHEVKGQTYLIDACRTLRDRGFDFICHLVGDGPDRPALTQQVAQSGLQDHVRFHGQCTREDVARLLGQANVLVAPSVPASDGRREGIPVVLMEAMATGVPVVASRLSGIPELVHHEVGGLLVPPGDAAALADAIARVHQEPDTAVRRAEAARQRVEREFDLHRNAAALAELFRRAQLSCPAASRETECLEHLMPRTEVSDAVSSGCLTM